MLAALLNPASTLLSPRVLSVIPRFSPCAVLAISCWSPAGLLVVVSCNRGGGRGRCHRRSCPGHPGRSGARGCLGRLGRLGRRTRHWSSWCSITARGGGFLRGVYVLKGILGIQVIGGQNC